MATIIMYKQSIYRKGIRESRKPKIRANNKNASRQHHD